MSRLGLVTLLIITIATLLLHHSVDAAPILGSTLNVTVGVKNATMTTTVAAASESTTTTTPTPFTGNVTASFEALNQSDSDGRSHRFIGRAPSYWDDWLDLNRNKTPSIKTPAIATFAIDETTTTPVATTTTTVTPTTKTTTTVPTTTTTSTKTTTASTTTTTSPETTTFQVDIIETNATTPELIPRSSDVSEEQSEFTFPPEKTDAPDTQIEAGGSEDNDAPKINALDATKSSELTEIIEMGKNRNIDDDDNVDEYGPTESSTFTDSLSDSTESEEDSHPSDDEGYESSASTPSYKSGVPMVSDKVEISYFLPSDSEGPTVYMNVPEFVDKPYNGDVYPQTGDVYPQTLYDQANVFVHEFVRNHPGVSFVLLCTILAFIVMLAYLVVRECRKSRSRSYKNRSPRSVTADLYNTSSSSHFYQKHTVLPNQQEVTMQLVSSDIAEDTV